ncbi:unnamed protein product [Vicia faba]|nr:unnamed protein product [Vicia faba]
MKNRTDLDSGMCKHCGDVEEDVICVLRDCPKALTMWLAVISTNNHLWKWHNLEVHDENYQRPGCMNSHVSECVRHYQEARDAYKLVSLHQKVTRNIKWEPLPSGWVKINGDRAREGSGMVGCSGIIRGDAIEWLGGFSKPLCICSAYLEKLSGVFEGLCPYKISFHHIIIEIDSQQIINDIYKLDMINNKSRNLVAKIKKFINQGTKVNVKHIYGKANRYADALAKHSIIFRSSFVILLFVLFSINIC